MPWFGEVSTFSGLKVVNTTISGGSISYKSVFQIAFSERNVNFTPSIKSCFLSTLRSGAQKKSPTSPHVFQDFRVRAPLEMVLPLQILNVKKLEMLRFWWNLVFEYLLTLRTRVSGFPRLRPLRVVPPLQILNVKKLEMHRFWWNFVFQYSITLYKTCV